MPSHGRRARLSKGTEAAAYSAHSAEKDPILIYGACTRSHAFVPAEILLDVSCLSLIWRESFFFSPNLPRTSGQSQTGLGIQAVPSNFLTRTDRRREGAFRRRQKAFVMMPNNKKEALSPIRMLQTKKRFCPSSSSHLLFFFFLASHNFNPFSLFLPNPTKKNTHG